jgi:phospholipid transport system substrate-binding protein
MAMRSNERLAARPAARRQGRAAAPALVTLLALAALLLVQPPAWAAAADADPATLIEATASAMLQDLDAHRAEYRKDPHKIDLLVDRYLLPHFDAEYAGRMVLARHWTTATPEQRKRFIDAFYHSLLGNYGNALSDFTSDRLTVLPYKGDPAATNATVRSLVHRSDGSNVAVNYSLRRTDKGWLAWDVTVEGISYVKSFRDDFGAEIAQKGLDQVIARLEAQAKAKQ